MSLIAPIYLTLVLIASPVTFALWGWDKFQARRGSRRIPEATLHLASLLGGWPGALLGQQLFRHKTRKLSFQIRYWATVLLHLGLIIAWLLWPQ